MEASHSQLIQCWGSTCFQIAQSYSSATFRRGGPSSCGPTQAIGPTMMASVGDAAPPIEWPRLNRDYDQWRKTIMTGGCSTSGFCLTGYRATARTQHPANDRVGNERCTAPRSSRGTAWLTVVSTCAIMYGGGKRAVNKQLRDAGHCVRASCSVVHFKFSRRNACVQCPQARIVKSQ